MKADLEQAEEVAAGLSQTMKRAVRTFPECGGYIQYEGITLTTARSLIDRGIFAPSQNYAHRFTEFGLRVRSILERKQS